MQNQFLSVAFDVDGTLIYEAGDFENTPRYEIVEIFRHFKRLGCHMVIWSWGGQDYAEEWAKKLGLVAECLEKPVNDIVVVDITFDNDIIKVGKINIKV